MPAHRSERGNSGPGGLFVFAGGTANLLNDTFAGNTASNAGGGVETTNSGRFTMINVTIAYNIATSGGGIDVDPTGSGSLTNTLVADNTATTNPDVQGAFSSGGNNLIGNVGTATGFVGSDLVGTSTNPLSPKIGTLANNGGPTKTIALLAGSPAINAGNSAAAASAGITTDERGEPRFPPGGDGMVDIGAYEYIDAVFANTNGLS